MKPCSSPKYKQFGAMQNKPGVSSTFKNVDFHRVDYKEDDY